MGDAGRLAATYAEARARILDAATAAGAAVRTSAHPRRGPDGGELAVDVATLGDPTAPVVLVVVAGTHGVEGFCGSALQERWLLGGPEPPRRVRVELVHGLNPFGFAWSRRVDDAHVDLNRNFLDWTSPAPRNAEYDRIADLLVPASWTEAEQARTTAALFEVAAEIGLERMQAVISGGQYHRPDGVFYGGDGPTWSNRWLRAWAAERLAGAHAVGVVDLHTGLGPWGHGELIGHEAVDTDEHRRAVAWWGDVRSMVDGQSVSARLTGDWLGVLHELAPGAATTAVALEFGTVDVVTVLQALRADAWLHTHGDPTGAGGDAIRRQVRAAFADDDPAWLDACWSCAEPVLAAALEHLSTAAR